jgi:hypothetical protein
MRRALLASLVAALALPAGGAAKLITSVIVVGADGNSRTVRGGERVFEQLRPAHAAEALPDGRYVLVYPMLGEGLPAQPGRFYPETGAACFSWSGRLGACAHVESDLARRLAAVPLSGFAGPPTTIVRLVDDGVRQPTPSNVSVALELAINRSRLARPSARPARCPILYAARWRGPEAARRPTQLCLTGRGLWASGRMYETPAYLLRMARQW